MTTNLKEMRIAQLSSQKEWTLLARIILFQVSLKNTETTECPLLHFDAINLDSSCPPTFHSSPAKQQCQYAKLNV